MAYRQEQRLLIAQYQPGVLCWNKQGTITLRPRCISTHYAPERENAGCRFRSVSGENYELKMNFAEPELFTLTLRIPEWLSDDAVIEADGETIWRGRNAGLVDLRQSWHRKNC